MEASAALFAEFDQYYADVLGPRRSWTALMKPLTAGDYAYEDAVRAIDLLEDIQIAATGHYRSLPKPPTYSDEVELLRIVAAWADGWLFGAENAAQRTVERRLVLEHAEELERLADEKEAAERLAKGEQ